MTSYRALARNHDFTVLWTGQTISDLGSHVSMFAFPLVTYAISGSALWAAVVEAAFLIGMCGSLLPAGVLADRVDRRRLMRTASGAGVLLYASLAVAGYLGALTVPHLAVVALLTGVAGGLAGPAEISARARSSPARTCRRRSARTRPASTSRRSSADRWAASCTASRAGSRSPSTPPRSRSPGCSSAGSAPTSPRPTAAARPAPLQDIGEGLRFIRSWPYYRALWRRRW